MVLRKGIGYPVSEAPALFDFVESLSIHVLAILLYDHHQGLRISVTVTLLPNHSSSVGLITQFSQSVSQ